MSASWLIEIADLQAKFSKVPSIGSMCRTYPEALTLENFSFFFWKSKVPSIGSMCSTPVLWH
jgi:hypothetical protein